MILRFLVLWEKLRSSYWFVPSLMAILATALAFGMAKVDEGYGAKFVRELGWIYTGGPDGARSVLSAIASSVMGVAGTTFSITIAVLSLTSGQYGPRLLRSFMRDTGNQIVLGTFTATFLYCLLVLRTIRGTEQTTYVPHFSVTTGVLLAIFSVGVLIYFVHHTAESIQVSHIIEEVGKDADEMVGRLFPEGIGQTGGDESLPGGDPGTVCADEIGYVQSIDQAALLRFARKHGLVIRIEVRPGDYVLPEMQLLSVWPKAGDHGDSLKGVFNYGRQRTTAQDSQFAFLQLAEIAVRALSPGINDPFTAMSCLDRITASMCLLAVRGWPDSRRFDEAGALRVVARAYEPWDLVQAGYGHILDSAKDSPAVMEKLRESLATLMLRTENPRLLAALQRMRSQM
ncbi:DUF2254 domain-containing protein [soil metagenome]